MNWGEVIGKIYKLQGRYAADALTRTLRFYGLEIVPVTAERAMQAALIKVDLGLSYADAMCVELAQSLVPSSLMTADHDFLAASPLVEINFLPNKPYP